MKGNIKYYFVALLSFLTLDYLWLGVVMKDFNADQLKEVGRFVEGEFDLAYGPAAMAYLLMALASTVFVKPRVQGLGFLPTFLVGGLMGLVVYGVFDATNLAILKNYPLLFSYFDVAWGFVVFGLVGVICKKVFP